MSQVGAAESSEESVDDMTEIRGRLADLEETQQYWKQRVQNLESDLEAKDERIDQLEQAVADNRQQVESFIGPVGSRTPREKRLADIKAMMIGVARGTDRSVKWSRSDIHEQLLSNGWDDEVLPKPTMFNDDIHELAESEIGFTKEKKTTETPDGAHRDVWHLVVDPDSLPENREPEAASSSTNAAGGRSAATRSPN